MIKGRENFSALKMFGLMKRNEIIETNSTAANEHTLAVCSEVETRKSTEQMFLL